MAITNNGTKVSLGVNQIPSGYTKPSITTFEDHEYTRVLVLTVLKSTVQNATEATTLTNIIENATIGINKQIDDILAADYLATATVTAYSDLTNIKSNIANDNKSDFYNNTVVSYLCTIKLFIKAQ